MNDIGVKSGEMLNENFAALLLRVVRIIVQIGILTIFYYMGLALFLTCISLFQEASLDYFY